MTMHKCSYCGQEMFHARSCAIHQARCPALKLIPNCVILHKKKLEQLRDRLLNVADGVEPPIDKGTAKRMAHSIIEYLARYRFIEYPPK